MAPAVIKAGPITRLCHVCGRQYGLSSFDIHLRQCKKLWVAQEELKPKSERRPIPKTPPGIGQISEDEMALGASTGGGGGNGKVDREAIEALNRAAQESFNVHGMEKCENCGRTFAEGRLAIHAKSCRPNQAAKKVGDGAAPRNKKEEVDYGRFRANMSGSGGDSSTSAAPPPQQAKKSNTRPATPSQDADAPQSSGSRALSGSIASNRKRIPTQDSGSNESSGSGSGASVSRSPSHEHIQTPLASSGLEAITPEALRQELRGKESAVSVIQAKLDQWEATTLATLQEIRDLKQIFVDL